MNDDKLIPLREVCKLIGLKPNTIRKWAKAGKLKFVKTPTGQIVYPKSQFNDYFNNSNNTQTKRKIIYCRVRSENESSELQRQINLLRSKYPEHEIITDCASGINWERKGLKSILESAMSGNLEQVIVAHKDRLSRFYYGLIKWIIEFNGGELIVLDDENAKSSEQELAEDLLSIIHIFSCKQMGKRKYKKHEDKVETNTTTEENYK